MLDMKVMFKFKLIDQKPYSYNKNYCQIEAWNASPDTLVKTEVLLYPWTSLVAEFGGILGLFLGFSFMTIWEGLQTLVKLGIPANKHWKNNIRRLAKV